MGFFDRLFKKDPEQELAEIEALLARGEADAALDRARRFTRKGPEEQRARFQSLARQAHDALAREFLGNAERAEADGAYQQAADWLETVLEHIEDDARRETLEQRIDVLIEKAKAKPRFEEEDEEAPEAQPASAGEADEIDEETHYAALVGMMREDLAERYEQLPPEFRGAFLAMNSGALDKAKPALDALVEEHDEALIRLERARCALMMDDAAAAREDLERVWPALGDDPIDLGDSLSAPALWAEAMLRLEQPEPVIERLAALADPAAGRQQLTLFFGLALDKAERGDEAVDHWAAAARKFETNPLFPMHLAQALDRLGEWAEAVQVMEKSVAPSCASGSCATKPKHPPSIRVLIALYLKQKAKPDRAAELLMYLEQAMGPRMTREDFLLAAECYRQNGDKAAAAEAEAAAEKLVGVKQEAADTPSAGQIVSADRAVL